MSDKRFQGVKLLIVEDEDLLRQLYIDILGEDGFDITSVATGREGLENLEKGGFDIVLLDIMLPSIDGLKILEKIKDKKDAQSADTVVLLTNLSHDQAIAKGTEFGVRGYLIKSDYNPREFKEELYKILSNMGIGI